MSLTTDFSNEYPVHNVCISGFEKNVHGVTNAEYAPCVDDGACSPPDESGSYTRPTYYGDHGYDDFPVIWADWFQASFLSMGHLQALA